MLSNNNFGWKIIVFGKIGAGGNIFEKSIF
jgi:hypothetical protein